VRRMAVLIYEPPEIKRGTYFPSLAV
jgi:hypothetical protein